MNATIDNYFHGLSGKCWREQLLFTYFTKLSLRKVLTKQILFPTFFALHYRLTVSFNIFDTSNIFINVATSLMQIDIKAMAVGFAADWNQYCLKIQIYLLWMRCFLITMDRYITTNPRPFWYTGSAISFGPV